MRENEMRCYFDNSATTRCFDSVAAIVDQVLRTDYGNPSSLHRKGVEAEQYLRYAKEQIAKSLKVQEKEILFTSGGTESDNLAIIGAAMANYRRGKQLITTRIEHPAVLQTMSYLESLGYGVTYLPVDSYGCIRLEDLEAAVTPETILVSIMHTNNEIGSIMPVEEAGRLIKQKNPQTLFHVDAVQGYGKCRIYPKKAGIDLLSVSGHKIHGPKGIGFLYVGEKAKIKPILFGGGQQGGMRSGTENVAGIAGIGKAVEEIFSHLDEDISRLYEYKEYFTSRVQDIPDVTINGPQGRSGAPHIVSLSVKGVRAEVLLHSLDDEGICISAGSACSAHKPTPSATLSAIGLERGLLESTVRFSFSVETTKEQLDYALAVLNEQIPKLRRYTRK